MTEHERAISRWEDEGGARRRPPGGPQVGALASQHQWNARDEERHCRKRRKAAKM